MAKRRSRIREAVNRVLYSRDPGRYVILYRHRRPDGSETLAEIDPRWIERVDQWAVHLAMGETIPLHRIVEIRDRSGRLIWRRGGEWLEK